MSGSGCVTPEIHPEPHFAVQIDTTPHHLESRFSHGFQRFTLSFNRTAVSLNYILVSLLARIPTGQGDVLHVIRESDVGYAGFGEAYLSWVSAGAIKAWKRHTRMTMNLVVPVGQVRFVFHAGNIDEFRVEEIGNDRYARLTIPPGIWFGFQGLAEPQSLVLNIANIPHDPDEVERLALPDIDYVWS